MFFFQSSGRVRLAGVGPCPGPAPGAAQVHVHPGTQEVGRRLIHWAAPKYFVFFHLPFFMNEHLCNHLFFLSHSPGIHPNLAAMIVSTEL